MSTKQVPLFAWDNDYDNTEQVRLYMRDFLKVYSQIKVSGAFPYNDSFRGQVKGLAGSPDEDTGIYLLQRLKELVDKDERIEAFGGTPLSELDLDGKEVRGTLMRHSFYLGGTGCEEWDDVRVTTRADYVLFKQPRQRNWRYIPGSFQCFSFRKAGA